MPPLSSPIAEPASDRPDTDAAGPGAAGKHGSSRIRSVFIASALVLLIGDLNYLSGPGPSFILLYLLPVAIATWRCGRRVGAIFCAVSAAVGLLVALQSAGPLTLLFWNTGIRLGVFLTFCALFSEAHLRMGNSLVLGTIYKWIAASAALALILAGTGLAIQKTGWKLPAGRGGSPQARPNSGDSFDSSSATPASLTGREASELLANFAAQVPESTAVSRGLLLGSRDPNAPSCVPTLLIGDVRDSAPLVPADLDGGPGTSMAALVFFDRGNVKSPLDDLNWHQHRLRQYLQNEANNNTHPMQLVHELADRAARLAAAAAAWTSFPGDLTPSGFSNRDNWPAYCLASLDAAVREKDLEQTRRWSAELAAATFAMEDLHRWLAFLVQNHLAALDFQEKCQTLFSQPNPQKYDLTSTLSQYPAGLMTLNCISNFLEVERQAERMFSMPSDRLDELKSNAHFNAASVWVSPGARECFLKLETSLNPHNRSSWEQAARMPFDHSYLMNMLYRAWQADRAEQLRICLRRFDANYPNATPAELMSCMMYRGHAFAGLEWADRFQPALMNAATQLSGSDEQAFMQACNWVNGFYRLPATYGLTYTLRDAIEKKQLDCVRSTDMIGAIFRNGGRTRFGNVWWSAGTSSHAVAALLSAGEAGRPRTLLADGLNPPGEKPEVWPEAYFTGHAWPAALADNAPPYSAELYVRGIDNYVWAEGYIIRGPNAGTLSRTAIPYIPGRDETSTQKAYSGPYPN